MVNVTTTGWVSEPVGRGTFGILRSCIATLILCVYTSIHLNVFPPETTWWWRLFKKLQWVLIGMFTPEYVIYVAWVQRETARNLHKAIQEILRKQKEENPGVVRKHEWTFTHSWYAVMGGFMFNTNDEGEDAYIPGSKPVILLPRAVEEVAKMGHLPDMPCTLILDKSKADSFTKAVVIVQASWLVLQCITRWITHLPVTKLELNTLAHAVCALLIYALWWDKPLDVRDPTMLSGEWTRPVCAAMYTSSLSSNTFWLDDSKIPEAYQRAGLMIPGCSDHHNQLQRHVDWSRKTVQVVNLDTGKAESRPISKQTHRNSTTEAAVVLRHLEIILPLGIGMWSYDKLRGGVFLITPSVTTRWQILFQAHHELGFLNAKPLMIYKESRDDQIFKTYGLRRYYSEEMVTMGPTSLVGDSPRYRNSGMAFFIFVLCAVAYGGIHAVSWNGFFSSATERLLWQISSISVTGCSILTFLFYRLDKHSYLLDGIRNDVSVVFMVLLALFYGFCRSYLVVEAFISLRKMQLQAYESPAWTQLLPHL